MPQAFRDTPHKPSPNDSIGDMLSAGHFRVAAQTAANQLKYGTELTDYSTIFSLLYIRLTCLSLLDYHFEAAQEAKALQDLNGPFYRDSSTGVHLAPWELRLLVIRLQAIGIGDWRRGIIGFYEMARECRWHHARVKEQSGKALWKQRLADLGFQVAHALIEMGDMDAAARHLESLLSRDVDAGSAPLQLKLGLIYLRMGDICAAKHWLAKLENSGDAGDGSPSRILQALTMMAEGEFDLAAELWQELANRSHEDDQGLAMMLRQNQAVCLVYSGRIPEVSFASSNTDCRLTEGNRLASSSKH